MRREELNNIILRIEKERPNFEHIIKGLLYNSDLHKKAVEVYSFELLEKEISKLKTIKKFKEHVEQILIYIKRKDVLNLTSQLDKLKPKLVEHLQKMKPDTEKTEGILCLNPNFYGIGINLKALWNRITNKKL